MLQAKSYGDLDPESTLTQESQLKTVLLPQFWKNFLQIRSGGLSMAKK